MKTNTQSTGRSTLKYKILAALLSLTGSVQYPI